VRHAQRSREVTFSLGTQPPRKPTRPVEQPLPSTQKRVARVNDSGARTEHGQNVPLSPAAAAPTTKRTDGCVVFAEGTGSVPDVRT
jgi:hypothetical protein